MASSIAPGDAAAIARAVRELGDDPDRRARMATRNRARAEQLLSWTHGHGSLPLAVLPSFWTHGAAYEASVNVEVVARAVRGACAGNVARDAWRCAA